MSEEDKLKINIEHSQTGIKGNIECPVQPINELVAVTTRCMDTIRTGSEKVGEMLRNSTNAIGKPIDAWLTGKAQEISANSQLIVANIMYKKEVNATKHLQYVAEEFNKKVENNEQIPEQIEASDNLLLIQDNASSTSNEEFLKLWAKFYTEEACKPGSISRKTIKILETLDINIVKILEKEILPYCDENGYYWGTKDEITNILILIDYGLIENSSILSSSKTINTIINIKLNKNYRLCIYPNYAYGASYDDVMYRLTVSGVEIFKNLGNDINSQNNELLFNNIKKASKDWQIATPYKDKIHLKHIPNNDEKFIICDNDNIVVYPETSPFKTLQEFIDNASQNIEVIEDAK